MYYRVILLNPTFYIDQDIINAFNINVFNRKNNYEMVIVQDGGSFETKIFLIEPVDLVQEVAIIRQVTDLAHLLAWIFVTIRK